MHVLGERTVILNPKDKPTSTAGFTIVELLIVIIVIGILAALVLVAYSNVTNQAKVTSLKGDLTQAAKQLAIDREKGGGYGFPTSLASANSGTGITPSGGAAYLYAANNQSSPQTYCLQETLGGITYYVAGTGNTASPAASGTCPLFTGLVSWWTLNGNANDSTAGGVNGSINGATPAIGQNGTTNGAYSLTTGNTINFGTPTTLTNATTSLSMSGWYKPTSALSNEVDIMRWSGVLQLGFINSYVRDLVATNATSGWTAANDVYYNFVPGTWYFRSLSWDGANLSIYINGALVKTAVVTGNLATNTYSLGVNNNNNMQGTVDDLRIYNRALTAADMASLYAAGAQ